MEEQKMNNEENVVDVEARVVEDAAPEKPETEKPEDQKKNEDDKKDDKPKKEGLFSKAKKGVKENGPKLLKGAAKTTGKVILGAVTIVAGVFACGFLSGLGERSDDRKKAEEDTDERDKSSSEEDEKAEEKKAQEAETAEAAVDTEDSGSVNEEDF